MPDTLAISLQSISDWDWLCRSAVRAARGKRGRSATRKYFSDFENAIQRARNSLVRAQLPRGHYHTFSISDPKPRIIHAAPFEDRVVHHALIGRMASRFELGWVDSSYACRPGKGAHAAVLAAHHLARRGRWLVKLDVHSFFACIDHDILLHLLQRRFCNHPKDGGASINLFALIENILDTYHAVPGKGLPIGSLTSQYFANHYLDDLQRQLRGVSGVVGELRYMDDVLIACDSKTDVRRIVSFASSWLLENRRLELKPPVVQNTTTGLTFCGFRIGCNVLKPARRRSISIASKTRRLTTLWRQGKLTESEYQQGIASILALYLPSDDRSSRKRLIGKTDADRLC